MKFYFQMFRGESRVITVSISDPVTGLQVDLTTGIWQVSALEWQVKLNLDDPDPPLISKSIGSGITIAAGAVTDQVAVTVLPADTTGLLAHTYTHDLVATLVSGARIWLIDPSGMVVRGVVNQL